MAPPKPFFDHNWPALVPKIECNLAQAAGQCHAGVLVLPNFNRSFIFALGAAGIFALFDCFPLAPVVLDILDCANTQPCLFLVTLALRKRTRLKTSSNPSATADSHHARARDRKFKSLIQIRDSAFVYLFPREKSGYGR